MYIWIDVLFASDFPSHNCQKGPFQYVNRGKLQLEKYISGTDSPVIYNKLTS